MTKRIVPLVSTLVAMVLFLVSFNEVEAKKLPDIPDKYAKEINYLVDRGYILGRDDGKFQPNAQITRGEAAVILGRVLDLDGTKRKTKFSDVNSTYYASGYIDSASKKGIITGTPDGKYKPLESINRGDAALLIARAFNLTKTGDAHFIDLRKVDYREEGVNKTTTAGITTGYPGGTFKPNNTITRTEFSIMVARALNDSFKAKYVSETATRYVTADSLNLRKGPGTNHGVIKGLPRGTKVDLHFPHDDNWVYISAGAQKGYVNQSYLSTSKPKPAGKKRVIAIDAGHGGSDPGSSGNGLVEKEVTLNVAKRVESKLKSKGVNVIMTRTNDTYVSLDGRVKIAVDKGADTFVSIHTNAFSNGSANGSETYYSTASVSRADSSKKLAEFIQARLVKALNTTNRGVKTANFRVITKTPLPSALVELGFITNKSDADKLGSDKYRDAAAEAITLGIIDYYNWKEK